VESTAFLQWSKPSCGGQLITYIFDNGVVGNAGTGSTYQFGNYFPLSATTSGLVMSFDMAFTQWGTCTAQSCIVYIYNAAHTLIGQSDPFINTAATYPGFTWVHATVTNGVAFSGPFYAMIDYNSGTFKNGICWDITTTTYDPLGLGWEFTPVGATWGRIYTVFSGISPPVTCIMRATCFVYGKDKAGELQTYGPPLPAGNTTIVPGNTAVAGANNISVPAGDPPSSSPSSPSVVTLLGYNLTRDGTPLPYINNPNTLSYMDNNLNPGIYHYLLTSYWDVTPIYPLHDNSAPVGPVIVNINYGRPLPFYEPWDMGTFDFNAWTHVGNWSITSGFGNPAPCADFSWQPQLTNYNDSLACPTLSAAAYSCAKIYLDYDYQLIDRNHTGAEFLTVEQLLNGTWKKIDEYSNNGNVNWTSKHFELKQTEGKAFKIRFRAHGANSLDILHWYVDNINVYAICNRPIALSYTESHNTVNLKWSKPVCKASGPPAQWIHWDDGVNYQGIGGPTDIILAGYWDASQITNLAGGSVSKIAFYPFNSGYGSGGNCSIQVYQGAITLPPALVCDQSVPTFTWDTWNTISLTPPVLIDVSQDLWIAVHYANATGYPAGIDAGPAVDNYGNMIYYSGSWQSLLALAGLDGNWNVQGYIETVKSASQPVILAHPPVPMQTGQMAASGHPNTNGINAIFNTGGTGGTNGKSILKGYNVYRTDSTANMSTIHKLNSALVTDTVYTDIIPLVGWGNYKYCVTAVSNDSVTNSFLCESPYSDTIAVQFPHVGIMEIGNGQIMVYPNPASDNVNVKSDYTVSSIEVMNYMGQTVYRNTTVNAKTTQFSVSTLSAGIYFLKVATDQGERTFKITVTR